VHAALIEQALVNVLENAARFSPPHGRLQLSAGVSGKSCFAVSDEGRAFPRTSARRFSTCSTPPPAAIAAGRAPAWAWRSVRAWSAPMAGASASPTASTAAAPHHLACRARSRWHRLIRAISRASDNMD
jgi:two-component system sensor histidine kinase KdpD